MSRRYVTRLIKPAVWHMIGKSGNRAAYEDRFAILLGGVLAMERLGKRAALRSVERSICCRAHTPLSVSPSLEVER